MSLAKPAPVESSPLQPVDLPPPTPAADEIVVDVLACGVCRTDLHEVEAELELPTLPIVPGHEIVGRVASVGDDVSRYKVGDRVGIPWVNRFCGHCDYCIEGHENLCLSPVFTGYHRNGGYAQQAVAPAAFALPIPATLGDDVTVAPLLCAGIIGYRALKQSRLRPGARIALFGFGGSAHVALQVAKAWGCEVFVVTRNSQARERARAMGADWTADYGEPLPRKVDHAVTFAPAGAVIPEAMSSLRRGGTLAVAGIYLDHVPQLDYDKHLFQERCLVSVTANTRSDAMELLTIAGNVGIHPDVQRFELQQANEALQALKHGTLTAQAAVLDVAHS
jgi:propanol-preferring alcohol dehydrogenase